MICHVSGATANTDLCKILEQKICEKYTTATEQCERGTKMFRKSENTIVKWSVSGAEALGFLTKTPQQCQIASMLRS